MEERMRKNKLYTLCLIFAMLVMGFLLSSCCSPRPCVMKIEFIGVDPDLPLETYSKLVEFNGTEDVVIEIPEGFDHTQMSASIGTIAREPVSIEFEKEIEEEYQYSIKKTITYNIPHIKNDITLTIDCTNMPIKYFDINLTGGLENFKVVTVSEDKLERMTSLRESDINDEVEFVDNKASIKYGEYAFLIHNKPGDNPRSYNSVFSEVNRFTEEDKISNIGTLEYVEYPVSRKGNSRYIYNGDTFSNIFYLGRIKESVTLYSEIPNYVEDKGFDFERTPNVFYLFTNLSEYNSDMCTIEVYNMVSAVYNPSDINQDKIGDVVLSRVQPSAIFNQRYDVHKIYLGEDLQNDPLISSEEKLTINTDLYIKVSSTMGLENLNMIFLNYERETGNHTRYKVDLSSDKGYKYIHVSKDIIDQYTLDRDMVDDNDHVVEYESGFSIFYVEVDYMFQQYDGGLYSRIWLSEVVLDTNAIVTDEDFHFMVYVKENGKKNYGLMDYHYGAKSSNLNDFVYFETSSLFNSNKQFIADLYITIKGDEYKDYKSIKIKTVNISNNREPLTPFQPAVVNDPKVFNGLEEYRVSLYQKEPSDEYLLKVELDLCDVMSTPTNVDFSQISKPSVAGEVIYVTNDIEFDNIEDFDEVYHSNKGSFGQAGLSPYYDMYYLVRCYTDPNFDFEIRLDPNDPDTAISSSAIICDIIGNPLTIEINGEVFYVRVMMMDEVYEFLDGKIYAIGK